jgi:hypothetical protein
MTDVDPVVKQLQEHIDALKAQRAEALWERNRLIALAARMALRMGHKAGVTVVGTAWDVTIELPTGQVTWVIPSLYSSTFADLPDYQELWDGHRKSDVPERIDAAFPIVALKESES